MTKLFGVCSAAVILLYAVWLFAPRYYDLPSLPLQPEPAEDLPASQAHNPAISLVRFITIGQGKRLRGPTTAGYWELMVSATSSADAAVSVAIASCTFFDKAGEPLGNADAVFNNLQPGQTSWSDADLKAAAAPASASCSPSVAYNYN